ncbi:MAG TPA: hypothetical protein VKZ79_25275 [Alphaproteobacteria bacterium]|nr:hypothetical protein [Alphaproteobacteria bacterium]
MPDDSSQRDSSPDFETAIPFALMAIGAARLLGSAPLLGLSLLGCWLYPLAANADRQRRKHGRNLEARKAQSRQLDQALEATFPASDPPAIH